MEYIYTYPEVTKGLYGCDDGKNPIGEHLWVQCPFSVERRLDKFSDSIVTLQTYPWIWEEFKLTWERGVTKLDVQ